MRAYSSTERALRKALAIAEERGARTTLLAGADIDFPSYAPENPDRPDAARHYVDILRSADAVIIGSPGYHGAIFCFGVTGSGKTYTMSGHFRHLYES